MYFFGGINFMLKNTSLKQKSIKGILLEIIDIFNVYEISIF